MDDVRRSLAAYLVATLATAALLVGTLELWRSDPRVPLDYEKDSLTVQAWAKGVAENGWYLTNPSLGAPFGQEMHDYPLVDSLHFAALKALCRATGDYRLAVNGYFYATFFLATLAATFALRRLGVPRGPAVVCAVLYAFLPYHFLRGEMHLFLSGYYLVPLAALVCVRLFRDGELLFREPPDGGRARLALRGRRALGAVLVAALLGSGGVYYAFFTCYLLLVAGACAAAARRRVHPLGSAALLIAIIGAGVAANLAPKVLYERAHGPNLAAVHRVTGDVELFGLRIIHMLMPVQGHRLEPFRRLREAYDREQAVPSIENGFAGLGVVGGAGFLGLLAAVALGRRLRGVDQGTGDGLAKLNLAALLLATTGGLGALFGYLVSPMIRGYNRMSVFIAFFALAAVAIALGRVVRAARPGWPRLAVRAGLGLLLVVGVLDQSSPLFVPDYAGIGKLYRNDAAFVGRIEATLPPGSMVFQLPAVEFPEAGAPLGMRSYDLLRPYLHSRSLRWSFAAMKGRPADGWQKHVFDQPPDEMLATLALAGFQGVFVERNGYPDRGAAVEAQLASLGGVPPIASEDGRLAFLDLRPFATALRDRLGPEGWAAGRRRVARPVLATWGRGFGVREFTPPDYSWHWAAGEGEIRLTNPSTAPRRVELTMELAVGAGGDSKVRIEGPGGTTEHPAAWAARGAPTSRTIDLPPGETTLRFRCDAPPLKVPGDERTLVFRVERLRVEDVGEAPPVASGDGDPKARR